MSSYQEQPISSENDVIVHIRVDGYATPIPLSAKHLAESAVTNKVDFESFIYTLDNFSDQVVPELTELKTVYDWRACALDTYYRLCDVCDHASSNNKSQSKNK